MTPAEAKQRLLRTLDAFDVIKAELDAAAEAGAKDGHVAGAIRQLTWTLSATCDALETMPRGTPKVETIDELLGEATRAAHLAWCKTMALEYVDSGELMKAAVIFVREVAKHPETKELRGVLGMSARDILAQHEATAAEIRRWIKGVR